jgi:hypothetical protein
MPPKRNRSEPPVVMTWSKALPVLTVCVIFDVIRFAFEQFLFFGPALAGIYCTIKVSPVIGTVAGTTVCSAAAVAAGLASSVAIEVFGVMMAMAVGFFGWLTVGTWLFAANKRIFKANAGNALWYVGGLLVSVIPIVGSLPALTGTTVKMYRTQIQKEREQLRKYEEEQTLMQQRELNREQAALLETREREAIQEEEEAANDERYNSQEAANDEQIAIPEPLQKAA